MSIALMIVVGYMALLGLISWLSAYVQRGNGSAGFLFANRKLAWPLVGAMIGGIAIGGSATVGVAQNAYSAGLSAGWYNLAWSFGPIFIGLFLAKKMRRVNVSSLNQIFGAVFGTSFEMVSALIQIIVLTAILAVQIVAGGAILTALLPDSFSMSTGILLSAVVFGMIAVTGGLLAASLSNVLNLVVIYIGILLGVATTLRHNDGLAGIMQALPKGISGDGSHWFNFTSGLGYVAIMSWIMTMFFQALSNSGVILNFLAARSPRDAAKGAFFGALIMIPAGFLTAFLGVAAAAQLPGLENSAMALPMLVSTFPAISGGILLAGLWAADVSTATGMLIAVGSAISEDILHKHFPQWQPKTPRGEVIRTRSIIAVVVLVSYFAAGQMSNILGSLLTALALLAPYSILVILIFMVPGVVRQSTGWWVLGMSTLAFVLAQFLVPEMRLMGQTVFTCAAFGLAGLCISQVDRRPASIAALYHSKAEEAASPVSLPGAVSQDN